MFSVLNVLDLVRIVVVFNTTEEASKIATALARTPEATDDDQVHDFTQLFHIVGLDLGPSFISSVQYVGRPRILDDQSLATTDLLSITEGFTSNKAHKVSRTSSR